MSPVKLGARFARHTSLLDPSHPQLSKTRSCAVTVEAQKLQQFSNRLTVGENRNGPTCVVVVVVFLVDAKLAIEGR